MSVGKYERFTVKIMFIKYHFGNIEFLSHRSYFRGDLFPSSSTPTARPPLPKRPPVAPRTGAASDLISEATFISDIMTFKFPRFLKHCFVEELNPQVHWQWWMLYIIIYIYTPHENYWLNVLYHKKIAFKFDTQRKGSRHTHNSSVSQRSWELRCSHQGHDSCCPRRHGGPAAAQRLSRCYGKVTAGRTMKVKGSYY